jgi:hypothetical protein
VRYLTIGGLGLIWCGIWFWYLRDHPPETDTVWYWCYGGLLSSLGAFCLGLHLGRTFRAARCAVVPPENPSPASMEANTVKESVTLVGPGTQPAAQPVASPERVSR